MTLDSLLARRMEMRPEPREPTIRLPPPFLHGESQMLSMMEAFEARASARAFSAEPLFDDLLSTLLWAANGINRAATGGRTAPSAHNWQEIDVYVTLSHGLYLYDVRAHALKLVLPKDLRQTIGAQGYTGDAPLNLVYVADTARMPGATGEEQEFFAATDAAAIAENVHLFCAATKLATLVRRSIDRKALRDSMGLKPQQRIILVQTVGYPAGW